MEKFSINKFSIDYLTLNSIRSANPINVAQITFSNHDGVMARDGSNYMNSSLHLEDVYRVIFKDNPALGHTEHESPYKPNLYKQEIYKLNIAPRPDIIPRPDIAPRPVLPFRPLLINTNGPVTSTVGVIHSHTSSLPYRPQCHVMTDINRGEVTSPVDRTNSTDVTSGRGEPDRGTPSPYIDSEVESDISSNATNKDPNGTNKENTKKTIARLEKTVPELQTTDKAQKKRREPYFTMIARALLSSNTGKMALRDICNYIRDNYSCFDNEDKAWRSRMASTLSVNGCFIKVERHGNGSYWAVHPNCLADFKKGDFRRRQARRRALRSVSSVSSSVSTRSPSDYVTMRPHVPPYQPYVMLPGQHTSFTDLLMNHTAPYFLPPYVTAIDQSSQQYSRFATTTSGYNAHAQTRPEILQYQNTYEVADKDTCGDLNKETTDNENSIIII